MLIGIAIITIGFAIIGLDKTTHGFGFMGLTLGPIVVLSGFLLNFTLFFIKPNK